MDLRKRDFLKLLDYTPEEIRYLLDLAKDFKKNNPALSFMDAPEQEARQEARTKQAPEGYKVNPEFIETKTKRVQLLLQPSVVEAIKATAKKEGLSMNEAISQAIQDYVEKHRH